jgi:hypothetical protein
MKILSQPQRMRLVATMEQAAANGGWDALHARWTAIPARLCLSIETMLLPDFYGMYQALALQGKLGNAQPIDPVRWNIASQGIGAVRIVETTLIDAVLACANAPHLVGIAVAEAFPVGAALTQREDEEEIEAQL